VCHDRLVKLTAQPLNRSTAQPLGAALLARLYCRVKLFWYVNSVGVDRPQWPDATAVMACYCFLTWLHIKLSLVAIPVVGLTPDALEQRYLC
jgi:uncharacterized membrane protein YozB (DUF420 family)